jgi:hypothetical protein
MLLYRGINVLLGIFKDLKWFFPFFPFFTLFKDFKIPNTPET